MVDICIDVHCVSWTWDTFYWIPRYLRVNNKRNNYFRLLKVWDAWTSCVHVWGDFYFQPSLVLLGILFVGLNVGFCFAEINDLDYQSRFYIISKRLLKVAVGNLPILLFAVMKNDFVDINNRVAA